MIFLVLSCFSGIMIFFLSLLCFLSCFSFWFSDDLEVKRSSVSIITREVWGAIRGMETFSQLVYQDEFGDVSLFRVYSILGWLTTCVHFFQLDVPQSLWLILNFSEGAVMSCLNFQLLLTYNNKFFGFSLSAGTSAISAMNLIMWIF